MKQNLISYMLFVVMMFASQAYAQSKNDKVDNISKQLETIKNSATITIQKIKSASQDQAGIEQAEKDLTQLIKQLNETLVSLSDKGEIAKGIEELIAKVEEHKKHAEKMLKDPEKSVEMQENYQKSILKFNDQINELKNKKLQMIKLSDRLKLSSKKIEEKKEYLSFQLSTSQVDDAIAAFKITLTEMDKLQNFISDLDSIDPDTPTNKTGSGK